MAASRVPACFLLEEEMVLSTSDCTITTLLLVIQHISDDIILSQGLGTPVMQELFSTERTLTSHLHFFAGREAWKPSDDWSKFDDCLKTRNAGKINKEADAVLKYLKEQCGAKKLGVIGFCCGGIAVHHLMVTYPELKAGISLYGLIKHSGDISNLLNPTCFIFAEKDDFIPLHQVILLEQKLKENCKVNYEVKIYPRQTHSFVHCRREDINPQDRPYIEEEEKNMISWLKKYI
ncbi:PREDICTED: carboxymethylenebutenolidase homolog [Cariama cristata]|nr:PREDICTED: carboxymethylenebutenolidase homolog [Cariama cristata]